MIGPSTGVSKQRSLGEETHRPSRGDADDDRINERVRVIGNQQNRSTRGDVFAPGDFDLWIVKTNGPANDPPRKMAEEIKH
jgi:hypothetical protein